MFTIFNVIPHKNDTNLDGWKVDKLGEKVQANQMDMQARRGNAHQQGILDGFEYSYENASLIVHSVDGWNCDYWKTYRSHAHSYSPYDYGVAQC